AGIAAVFNAPMAGIFFTLEVILRDFSLRTFTPIVVSSVVGAATAQTLLGTQRPLFGVGPEFFRGSEDFFTLGQTPLFIALGVFCAFPAVGFIRLLPTSERLFHRVPLPRNLRPAVGAVLLAALGGVYLWVTGSGEVIQPFFGAGYATTRTMLDHGFYAQAMQGAPSAAVMLAGSIVALGVLKAVATCLTLGSSGAGGLFAPSLLLGALVGGAFGLAIRAAGVPGAPDPSHCALVGMAAMIAATTHAPLTGVLLVYELTRSYSVVLPLMLTAVIATMVSRLLHRDSIYTAELSALGIRLGGMSDLTVLRRLRVSDLELAEPILVQPGDPAQKLVDALQRRADAEFVVLDAEGRCAGMVTSRDMREALVHREAIPLLDAQELMRDDLPSVLRDDTLDVALDRFSRHDVESLPVVDSHASRRVLGLVSRRTLLQRYQRELETGA
ncbi:MAG: chloride channel protein, partial [Planctomycetota bacterium]